MKLNVPSPLGLRSPQLHKNEVANAGSRGPPLDCWFTGPRLSVNPGQSPASKFTMWLQRYFRHRTASVRVFPRVRRRDGRFGQKVGQIGTKWDKSGTFSDEIWVYSDSEIWKTNIWDQSDPHSAQIWHPCCKLSPSVSKAPSSITSADLELDRCREQQNIGQAIGNILTDLERTPEMSYSGITPKILTFEYYAKNKQT